MEQYKTMHRYCSSLQEAWANFRTNNSTPPPPYTKQQSLISVTPQLFGPRWNAPITHRIGWWTCDWSGRGGERKYLQPCWDMNVDIWACSSYPMNHIDRGHHNMEQPACLVKAVRRLPLRDVGFPCAAYTTSIVRHRLQIIMACHSSGVSSMKPDLRVDKKTLTRPYFCATL